MERIQKALQKAREQREELARRQGPKTTAAETPVEHPPEPAQPEATAAAPDPAQPAAAVAAPDREPAAAAPATVETATNAPAAEPAPAGEISYSQTRVVLPSLKRLRENRVVADVKEHPQADLFRVLRTKILHKLRKGGIKSIGITSPSKGSGKSMIAANLAVSLSMEVNHTVMLVDLDLRRPSLHDYFDFKPEKGLSDHLLDGAELAGLLINPGIERLVLLPAGRPVPSSSELLSTPRMANLVKDITSRYPERIILFDLPPLLHLDDALAFLPQVQSTLLVVEEGVDTPADVSQCLHLLEGTTLLGTVLNKARHVKYSPY